MNVTATLANAMLTAGLALANGGTLEIYDGVQPTTGGGAISGNNLLVSFPLPGFNTPVNGVISAQPIVSVPASIAGTATWFRVLSSTGSVLFDGTVGTTGAELNLSSTAIAVADVVSVSSFTITLPVS